MSLVVGDGGGYGAGDGIGFASNHRKTDTNCMGCRPDAESASWSVQSALD